MTSSKHRYFSEKLSHKFSQLFQLAMPSKFSLTQIAEIAVFRTRRDLLLPGCYHKCLPQNVHMKGIPKQQVNVTLALPRSGTSVLDSIIIFKC